MRQDTKILQDGTIYITGVVAEYNKTSKPVNRKAQYHAGEYCLACYLPTSVNGLEALLDEAKKENGCVVEDNEGRLLYNFYSRYPFAVEDEFGDYSPSDQMPNLKQGTEIRLVLKPIENKYRKSGIHYVVNGIQVFAIQKFTSRFEKDGE